MNILEAKEKGLSNWVESSISFYFNNGKKSNCIYFAGEKELESFINNKGYKKAKYRDVFNCKDIKGWYVEIKKNSFRRYMNTGRYDCLETKVIYKGTFKNNCLQKKLVVV